MLPERPRSFENLRSIATTTAVGHAKPPTFDSKKVMRTPPLAVLPLFR